MPVAWPWLSCCAARCLSSWITWYFATLTMTGRRRANRGDGEGQARPPVSNDHQYQRLLAGRNEILF